MTREVFLAYTTCETLGWVPELLAVYKKSSYRKAYDWIATIAERHGNDAHPMGLKYPTAGRDAIGLDRVVVQVVHPINGQRWWLERHEVL